MTYALDDERSVTEQSCASCGRTYKLVKNFIFKDGYAHAIAFCACHHHGGENEVWIDTILGTWGEETEHHSDHVTFGARVLASGAMAVDAAIPYSDADLRGHKLTRSEALVHPWIDEFWSVLDFLVMNDPDVRDHIYGADSALK